MLGVRKRSRGRGGSNSYRIGTVSFEQKRSVSHCVKVSRGFVCVCVLEGQCQVLTKMWVCACSLQCLPELSLHFSVRFRALGAETERMFTVCESFGGPIRSVTKFYI